MKMAFDLDDLAGKIGEFKQSTDVRTRGGTPIHYLYGYVPPNGGLCLQGGKTFCASFCASLIAGSWRALLCVDWVGLLMEF